MTKRVYLERYLDDDNLEVGDIRLLPVCHTTTEWQFFEIYEEEVFKSDQPSPPYEAESLVFFFYGKAKYVPRKDATNGYKRYLPVTLIFEMDKFESQPKRMLPFDSGGFSNYGFEINKIDYYTINNPSTSKVKQYVKFFYGSNSAYYKNEPACKRENGHKCYAIQELIYLHEHPGENFGEQAYTIELQYESHSMKWIEPVAIVIPFRLLTDVRNIEKIKKATGVKKLITYKTLNKTEVIFEQYLCMQKKVMKYVNSQ